MSRAGPAEADMEDIWDRVYILNKLVQKQLEGEDRRYMKLHEQYEKEKEEWR